MKAVLEAIMDQKQRLFIYDRKEMGALILLGVVVALFAFTLGVHLGKRMGPKALLSGPTDASPVHTVGEKVAEKHASAAQAQGAPQAVEHTWRRNLHDAVVRPDSTLDVARPVALPEEPSQGKGGATTLKGKEVLSEGALPAAHRPLPEGKFTLQVGSHPSLAQAREQINDLEAQGLKPFLRAVELKGKGKWYRVYLGGFDSKDAAEIAGVRFRARKSIQSFMVAKLPHA